MAVVRDQRPAGALPPRLSLVKPDDPVAWFTTHPRFVRAAGAARAWSGARAQRRLMLTSVVLTICLVVGFSRMGWLIGHPAHRMPVDSVLIPLTLACLLLLILATISWDRVQQRHLRHLRQRSAEAISTVRQTGERRLAALMSGTSDVVLVLAQDATVTYCSAMSTTVLGRTPASMRGRRPSDFLVLEDAERLRESLPRLVEGSQLMMELMATRRDGRTIPVEVTVTARTSDDAVGGFVLTIRDNSETSELAARLARQALVDPLTNLGNRRQFAGRVGTQLRDPAASATVVIAAGLMNFGDVNSRWGYPCGDQLIVMVAERLRQAVGVEVPLARLGGDTFGVLLSSDDAVDDMIDRIGRALSGTFRTESTTIDLR